MSSLVSSLQGIRDTLRCYLLPFPLRLLRSSDDCLRIQISQASFMVLSVIYWILLHVSAHSCFYVDSDRRGLFLMVFLLLTPLPILVLGWSLSRMAHSRAQFMKSLTAGKAMGQQRTVQLMWMDVRACRDNLRITYFFIFACTASLELHYRMHGFLSEDASVSGVLWSGLHLRGLALMAMCPQASDLASALYWYLGLTGRNFVRGYLVGIAVLYAHVLFFLLSSVLLLFVRMLLLPTFALGSSAHNFLTLLLGLTLFEILMVRMVPFVRKRIERILAYKVPCDCREVS